MTVTPPAWRGEFSLVEPRSTAEIIADQLRDAILHGHMGSGAQLSETELGERFGVSRGPIREAIQRLMQEGLLVRARNRGVFVAQFDEAQIRDIYLARSAVERAAMTRILEIAPPHAAEDLRRCVAKMEQAARSGSPADLTTFDLEFHNTLVALAGSDRLTRMQRTLLVEASICIMQLEGKYAQPLEAVLEHNAIVDALDVGDSERAIAAIDAHMATAIGLLTPRSANNE